MKRVLVPATFVALFATAAVAQAPPAAPPPPTSVAAVPSGQQVDIIGIVKAFTLTPVGDIEGIILTNGTEVHVPPHLTEQVAAALRPGESVAVRGWGTGVPNFVIASALTGQRGQSVVDAGPPPPGIRPLSPPPGQPAPGAQQATVQGRIQQVLHGPRGDTNGAILDDGTTLRVPPHTARQLASLLQPGELITAQGFSLSNSYGRVVDVQSMSPTPPISVASPPPLTGSPGPGPAGPPPPAGATPPPPMGVTPPPPPPSR